MNEGMRIRGPLYSPVQAHLCQILHRHASSNSITCQQKKLLNVWGKTKLGATVLNPEPFEVGSEIFMPIRTSVMWKMTSPNEHESHLLRFW